MDLSPSKSTPVSGIYRLVPVNSPEIAKMGVWMVKLTFISSSNGNSGEAAANEISQE